MSLKICWTIVREYKKTHGKLLREDLIQDLKDMSVPAPQADLLLAEDSVQFSGEDEDGAFFIALDILDDRFSRDLV